MKQFFKNKKGITLISLVITIILLIILAGIVISLGLGENGIFNKAKYAKEETNKQTATEKINLKITTAQMNSYAENQRMPTLKELSIALKEDNEIDYVTERSKVASTEYDISSENPSSIFTKLKEYPYEFEINGQLQLASVNGVKIIIENKEKEIKAYVLGAISSWVSQEGQCASKGHSSNYEYFTCEGGLARDYLIINILKDMDILICLQEAGRGTALQRIIQINDSIIDTTNFATGGYHEFETKVSEGDVIKITASGTNGAVRGTAINIFGM